MQTPAPYRTRTQASAIANAAPGGSLFEQRLDAFTRRMLLRAYRRHGNKSQAAKALGITYRSFRYHWARLIDVTKIVSD